MHAQMNKFQSAGNYPMSSRVGEPNDGFRFLAVRGNSQGPKLKKGSYKLPCSLCYNVSKAFFS